MEALLRLDPTDEAALSRLLMLLYKQGMKALALRRYQEHKRYLEGQGMTLSSTVEAVMQRIHASPTQIRENRSFALPTESQRIEWTQGEEHVLPPSSHPGIPPSILASQYVSSDSLIPLGQPSNRELLKEIIDRQAKST